MQQSVLGETLPGPASTTIDTRLIAGGTLFGMGWVSSALPGRVVPALGVAGRSCYSRGHADGNYDAVLVEPSDPSDAGRGRTMPR